MGVVGDDEAAVQLAAVFLVAEVRGDRAPANGDEQDLGLDRALLQHGEAPRMRGGVGGLAHGWLPWKTAQPTP